MNRICFISICLLCNYFSVLKLNAQQFDTIYFSCSFDRFGIKVKNIEIYDINNNQITILDNYHGRKSLPVQVILNNNSDTLDIKINQRFGFKKTHVFLRTKDIHRKYIHLWRNNKREFEFSYSDRLLPKL